MNKWLDLFKFDKKINKNPTVIMNIKHPILISYEDGSDVYIFYVIRFKRLKKTLDYLTVKSNYQEIENVIKKTAALNTLFKNKNIESVSCDFKMETRISHQVMANKICELLPKDDFYLDKKYPNTIDLTRLLIEVQKKKSILDIKNKLYELSNSVKVSETYRVNIDKNPHKIHLEYRELSDSNWSKYMDVQNEIETGFVKKVSSEVKR